MYHQDKMCDITRDWHLRTYPLDLLSICHKSAVRRDATDMTHKEVSATPLITLAVIHTVINSVIWGIP